MDVLLEVLTLLKLFEAHVLTFEEYTAMLHVPAILLAELEPNIEDELVLPLDELLLDHTAVL